jgi:flagellar transcriptional activator FlhD
MTSDQVLANIRETNLSYLALAQKLIAADRLSALTQLGISDESATMLDSMSPLQMMKISAGNTLLCSARITDDLVWGLITNHGRRAAQNDDSDASIRTHDCSYESANQALADKLLERTLLAA